MRILAANLKHLYQRRGYWLAYPVFGLLAYCSVTMALKHSDLSEIDMIMSGVTGLFSFMFVGKVHFMGLVLLALPVGLCATAVPIEILTKPFSYCLPGHRIVPVKFVLTLGIVVNMLGSLVFLGHPDLAGWQRVPVVCAAFGAGMMMYWLGVMIAWKIRYSVICFLPAVFIISRLLKLYYIVEQMIVESPFEIAGLGALCTLAGLWLLAESNQARRFCGTSRLGILDAGKRDKIERYWYNRTAGKKDWLKGHPHPWVEEFFLNRMNRYDYLGMGRLIWGGLYTTFAMTLSTWKWNLVSLPVYFIVFYTNSNGEFLLFIMLVGIVLNFRVPVCTRMCIPQGRKEILLTAAIVNAVIAVLFTAIMAAITATSVILAPIMPNIILPGGVTFTFHTVDIIYSYFLILAMPVALTTQLILYHKSAFTRVALVMLTLGSIAMLDIWSKIDAPNLLSMLLELIIKPIPIATFVASSWLVFILVLWHICMRRSLVGQSRTY